MSRTRHAKDPFYACNLQGMQAGTRGIVKELDALVKRSGYGHILWPGSGKRSGSVEHNSGTAIDYMVTDTTNLRPTAAERKAALEFLSWLVSNHAALRIEGILFSRDGRDRPEAWGYSTPGKGWRSLADRKSISGNHIDHLHIKFKSGASWPSSLNGSVIGKSTPTPTPPATGPSTKSIAQMADEVIAGKHGNGHSNRQKSLGVGDVVYAAVRAEINKRLGTSSSDQKNPVTVPAFPKGIGPGRSKPSAIPLQKQLKKAGYMASSVVENANYGPLTQGAVNRFHKDFPKFRSAGKTYDPAIGPQGWKFLFERY